jgi:Tfp pilus assembly protein PilF
MTRAAWSTLLAASLLAGCVQAPPAPSGLLDIAERPAEKALLGGLRAYEDAQYEQAETQLKSALGIGLPSPKDRAAAHKLLAFIYCTSNRARECEGEFRLARQSDPAFALSRSEAGHPLWGPVYQRLEP